MFEIVIPETHKRLWDELKEEFVYVKKHKLQLEHSLVSISKWESKWCKPYLTKENKTREELLDYIRCMTITQNVDPYVYYCLTNENMEQIRKYIEAPMTATTFSKEPKGGSSRETVTAEIIYYWMISYNIPKECEKWHLNRLLTLIRIFSIKESEQNGKSNKMSKRDIIAQNRALNAARRQKLGSKG